MRYRIREDILNSGQKLYYPQYTITDNDDMMNNNDSILGYYPPGWFWSNLSLDGGMVINGMTLAEAEGIISTHKSTQIKETNYLDR